jgi:ribosomal protein S18 acetylase RimI-like enzyme
MALLPPLVDLGLPGYRLCQGSTLDRSLLFKFMRHTYQELFPEQNLAHLSQTVENYLSSKTPLWWVKQEPAQQKQNQEQGSGAPVGLISRSRDLAIACLWMGIAVDQARGDRHSHIFLLYVDPAHRRQGLGTQLLRQAELWAKAQGDRQITLQVFCNNQPALKLYRKAGYDYQALTLVKPLNSTD